MMEVVLQELKHSIKKDPTRKVCKQCNELGHGVSSVYCMVNINKHNILKQKIKNYILSQNVLGNKTLDDCWAECSLLFNISLHQCKTLYNEIPMNELLDRKMDFTIYLNQLNEKSRTCYECKNIILEIQCNTIRIWKENVLCEVCWSNHKDVRETTWRYIQNYREIQCVLCKKNDPNERYHYDHLNMFDKEKSICSMVNEGISIQDIYKEINKCQMLCICCHHIVSDIEHKLMFTRIKQSLTRRFNLGEINEEEYNLQKEFYQSLYESKMSHIYSELQHHFIKKV